MLHGECSLNTMHEDMVSDIGGKGEFRLLGFKHISIRQK